MTDRTCETCQHGHIVDHSAFQRKQLRCFRQRTFRNGEIARHQNIGASIQFERDSVPEPHRVDGDKCGPGGKHWVAKEGAA